MNIPPPDPTQQRPTNLPRRAVPFDDPLSPKCDTAPRITPRSAHADEHAQSPESASASLTVIATSAAHGIVRSSVSGVIDATTCGTFSAHLDEITAAAHPFVLDLTGVPFISVGGLNLIEALAHTTVRLDIRWALAAQYSLHRFLTLLNIDAHIPSFTTVDAALAHLVIALGRFRPPG
ncbi:STAS domain-containing protein [Rhodococcus erythropolis]|uniref:STAS domain-containing protein n=1 Tax=Rhodococcus erythropolis TaxID=1833 RepID=UPI001BEA7FFF|nr:STAS domain-containing protein [Rhodococcus erythropolis]MBT2266060.1 STAS domain-containing protein [Rhodococcus erythropolis]